MSIGLFKSVILGHVNSELKMMDLRVVVYRNDPGVIHVRHDCPGKLAPVTLIPEEMALLDAPTAGQCATCASECLTSDGEKLNALFVKYEYYIKALSTIAKDVERLRGPLDPSKPVPFFSSVLAWERIQLQLSVFDLPEFMRSLLERTGNIIERRRAAWAKELTGDRWEDIEQDLLDLVIAPPVHIDEISRVIPDIVRSISAQQEKVRTEGGWSVFQMAFHVENPLIGYVMIKYPLTATNRLLQAPFFIVQACKVVTGGTSVNMTEPLSVEQMETLDLLYEPHGTGPYSTLWGTINAVTAL